MKKAEFKKPIQGKAENVQWVLRSRKFICVSLDRKRWCKKYLNRSYRRKGKQNQEESEEPQ